MTLFVVTIVKRAGMIGWAVEGTNPILHGVCHYRRRLEREVRDAIRRYHRATFGYDTSFQVELRPWAETKGPDE